MVNIKNIVIGIIIAVVFVMFCAYGTNLVYESPKYENYCNNSLYNPYKIPLINCTYNQNVESARQDCYNKEGTPISAYDSNGCENGIVCSTCNKEYMKAEENYSKNLFIISIIVSLIIIAIAAFLIQVASVSGGLMFGSLMYLVYGTARYWSFMNDWLRFIILGIALIILIYIGYRIAKRE